MKVDPNELYAALHPDDQPKIKAEDALSEEDAKYFEFYRKAQGEWPRSDGSAIPKKILLNDKEIEVYGTDETLSDLFDQLRSAGVHVQGVVSGEIASIQYNAYIASFADANMEDAIARATELLAASHQHDFAYHLNNNHTALRGCKCGLAFVGLMAGPSPDALQWHQIHESDQEG